MVDAKTRPPKAGGGAFPSPLPPKVKKLSRMTSMDRTESTVRNLLTAIEAPFYDVGVLSDRGMLPGLNSISAATVLERLPLLKYRNAHGSHIYIRPSGEHRFTTLDDLHETSLARLSADGFDPCAVVETSAGNFQAWLKHRRTFPKLLGTFAAQTLAEQYDADPSAADWRRFGGLRGHVNGSFPLHHHEFWGRRGKWKTESQQPQSSRFCRVQGFITRVIR